MKNESTQENGVSIKILYGSVTGKAKVCNWLLLLFSSFFFEVFSVLFVCLNQKLFANEFLKNCIERGITDCSLVDMNNYDPEDGLVNDVS